MKKKEGISRSSLLFHRMKREKQKQRQQQRGRSAPLSLCVSFTAGFLKKESGYYYSRAFEKREKKVSKFLLFAFFFLACVIFDG